MKRFLTITTATLALGALAACGDNDRYSDADDRDTNQAAENAAMDEQETDEFRADDTVAGTTTYGATDAAVNGDPVGQRNAELEQRLADADEATLEYEGNTYITDAALNIRDLTGAGVEGADGERVATVDDIIMSADGTAQHLLLSSGGFLGIGDKQITVAFSEVGIRDDDMSDERIVSTLSDSAIESVAEYDEATLADDMMMASELLGTEVALSTGEDTAAIHDVILGETGQADWLVLDTGIGGERYLVDFSQLEMTAGADGEDTYTVALSADRLKNETRIVYF